MSFTTYIMYRCVYHQLKMSLLDLEHCIAFHLWPVALALFATFLFWVFHHVLEGVIPLLEFWGASSARICVGSMELSLDIQGIAMDLHDDGWTRTADALVTLKVILKMVDGVAEANWQMSWQLCQFLKPRRDRWKFTLPGPTNPMWQV